MIIVEKITKEYGKKNNVFQALSDINIEIPDNVSVAIVGKSGSGKSTLMHTMSGLDHPKSGKVIIDDKDIFAMDTRRMDQFRAKQMGFVFQSFFVEGRESCFDNVSLSLETAKVAKSQRKAKIISALEAVELGDKIKSKASELSGGQKQRLAIARAIVNNPKIIFADEPTGNLDSATSRVIEKLLFDYQSTNQATVIIVTHDEELASRCDIIIKIQDGKIISQENNQTKDSKGQK